MQGTQSSGREKLPPFPIRTSDNPPRRIQHTEMASIGSSGDVPQRPASPSAGPGSGSNPTSAAPSSPSHGKSQVSRNEGSDSGNDGGDGHLLSHVDPLRIEPGTNGDVARFIIVDILLMALGVVSAWVYYGALTDGCVARASGYEMVDLAATTDFPYAANPPTSWSTTGYLTADSFNYDKADKSMLIFTLISTVMNFIHWGAFYVSFKRQHRVIQVARAAERSTDSPKGGMVQPVDTPSASAAFADPATLEAGGGAKPAAASRPLPSDDFWSVFRITVAIRSTRLFMLEWSATRWSKVVDVIVSDIPLFFIPLFVALFTGLNGSRAAVRMAASGLGVALIVSKEVVYGLYTLSHMNEWKQGKLKGAPPRILKAGMMALAIPMFVIMCIAPYRWQIRETGSSTLPVSYTRFSLVASGENLMTATNFNVSDPISNARIKAIEPDRTSAVQHFDCGFGEASLNYGFLLGSTLSLGNSSMTAPQYLALNSDYDILQLWQPSNGGSGEGCGGLGADFINQPAWPVTSSGDECYGPDCSSGSTGATKPSTFGQWSTTPDGACYADVLWMVLAQKGMTTPLCTVKLTFTSLSSICEL